MIRALSVVQAGSTRALRAGVVGVVAGALVLSGVVPAVAAVTTTPATTAGATALAQALAGPGTTVTGASYVSVPTTGTPNGTSNAAIGTFPTKAPNTFAILTTGSVANVTRTSGAPTTGTDLNTPAPTGRGTTVRDTTVLKVDLTAPVGANCLTFDFKFLTQEFPTYVGQKYNDGFVAELDRTTWTTATSGAITAPDDFALDTSSKVVSVNATGVGGLSAANGAGTEFNGAQLDNSNKPSGGATGLLQASKQVSPGAHSVYFSIFDQGDGAYDSAVFLHGLTVGFVPNPATNCVPGATPVNYQATMTPTGTTDQVGTPHTVTTTLTDSTGAPVANAAVGFTVSGANPTTGTGTTNGSGQASFTYTGSNHGKDQIAACYQPTGATTCLATTSVTEAWTAPVTVTADNQQITFGGADPTFTATVTGLSPGDSLTTAPMCGVAGAHTRAGSYPITCTGATAGPDYTVSAVAGTLTVSPAPVQIVVDNLSRTYGAPDPNPTYSVNGAPASVLTTPPTCTITGPDTVVGSYPIVCSGADAGPDYTITSTPGTLTVGTAAVTVTADSTSRVYGTPDPTFTATTSGLVGGDALTRAATCGVTDTHTAVGTYAITCSGADAGPNYSVGYASGMLTVTQAAGTVTPAPQSAVYGSADPTFAYTVSGLVGTDALTSAASCGVAGPHRAVGTYPITCSGGSAGANYTLTYGTATYTVTPAPVTVTADNVARVYDGTAATTSTATTAGLLAEDTLTTAPTCSVAAAHTAAGTYVITCTGADAGPNYAITYVPGTLTVGKASVTVTAKNASRTYGAPDPALTGVASGLVGSDSLVTPAGCSVAARTPVWAATRSRAAAPTRVRTTPSATSAAR